MRLHVHSSLGGEDLILSGSWLSDRKRIIRLGTTNGDDDEDNTLVCSPDFW
jgi:hypothetical protein